MPLIPLPGEGIEVPLSEYTRLRAFQGGGWFWDHENQQILRSELGDFLPRVEERPRGSTGGPAAVFQHFVGGVEAAGKSDAVGATMNRVPRAEYQRLQHALEALKRKAEDPHTDPTARRLIEKFSLPDPAQNPDLYRLSGPAWNRRLLVLWGCEKEPGTSLPPDAALQKLTLEPPAASFLRRLPLLLGLLLLLLLLAFLVYHLWPHHDDHLPVNGGNFITADSPTPKSTAPDAIPSGGSVAPIDGQGITPTGPNRTGNPVAPLSRDGTSPVPAATLPGRNARDTTNEPGTSPSLVGQSAPTPNLSNLSTPSASAVNTDSAGQASSPANAATSATSQAARPSALPVAAASPAASTSPTVSSSPTPPPSLAHSTSTHPSDHAFSPMSSPTDRLDSSPSSLVTPAASTSPSDTLPGPSSAASARPPHLEIINAPSSAPPHDGKLDLTLVATAHDANGGLATVEVTSWEVDGQRQQDRTGHDATGTQIALTLPPGQHRVTVAGTLSGLPVTYDAEVNVQIKSQGDVTVKQR